MEVGDQQELVQGDQTTGQESFLGRGVFGTKLHWDVHRMGVSNGSGHAQAADKPW